MSRKPADTVALDAKTAVQAAELAVGAARHVSNAPQRAAEQAAAVSAIRTRRTLAFSADNWLGRLTPRRNPWPELQTLDANIAKLDAGQAAAHADAQRLEQELRDAEAADNATLAGWHADGATRARPTPTAPAIRELLEQRSADRDALTLAAAEAVDAKVRHVRRNRQRLAKVADEQVGELHGRYLELLDELEQTRGDLLAHRAASLYVRLYPSEQAALEPPTAIALGLAKPVMESLGVRVRIEAAGLWRLLRADAALLPEAISSEQKAALHGVDPRREARWGATAEGRKLDRAEKVEQLEAYRREWGEYPE